MRLLELKDKYPLIGDVRGRGLMIGIELVRDRKEPAVTETSELFEKTKASGLLIGKGGLFGNVVRIAPPMTVDKPATDEAVRILGLALNDL